MLKCSARPSLRGNSIMDTFYFSLQVHLQYISKQIIYIAKYRSHCHFCYIWLPSPHWLLAKTWYMFFPCRLRGKIYYDSWCFKVRINISNYTVASDSVDQNYCSCIMPLDDFRNSWTLHNSLNWLNVASALACPCHALFG